MNEIKRAGSHFKKNFIKGEMSDREAIEAAIVAAYGWHPRDVMRLDDAEFLMATRSLWVWVKTAHISDS